MLLLINALQTFGYTCQRFSLSMTEVWLPPRLSEQLMHWLCRIQRLWRRSVLAPVRGEFSIFFSLFLSGLVHPLSAIPGSTMAGDLVLIVLEIKLVVVGQLELRNGES